MSLSVPRSDDYAMPVVAETQTGSDRHHAKDEGEGRRKPHQPADAGAGPRPADAASADGGPSTIGTLIDVRA